MRRFFAGLLLTVAALMVPVTLVSQWIQNYLLDTDNFTALYQPVAGKSAFQQYLAGQVSEAAGEAIEQSAVAQFTQSAAGAVDDVVGLFGLDLGLSDTSSDWVSRLGDRVTETVHGEALPALQSPQFAQVWTEGINQIHSQLITGLTGDGPDSQTLVLQAGPFVSIILEYLQQQGFSFVSFLAPLAADSEVVLVEVNYPPAARTFVNLIVDYGPYLPWVTAGIAALGLLLSRARLVSLGRFAFATAFLSALVWLVAPLLGAFALADVGGGQEVAKLLWDVAVTPLRSEALLVAGSALLLSIFAGALHLLRTNRS